MGYTILEITGIVVQVLWIVWVSFSIARIERRLLGVEQTPTEGSGDE